MSDKIVFIDHLQPTESQIRLLKAAEFFSSKDFAISLTEGLAINQYNGKYAFGILEGAQPTVRKVPYFFGMVHLNKKCPRPFIGTVSFEKSETSPTPQYFVNIYGRKNVDLFKTFAEEMSSQFNCPVELNLKTAEPHSEIFKYPSFVLEE